VSKYGALKSDDRKPLPKSLSASSNSSESSNEEANEHSAIMGTAANKRNDYFDYSIYIPETDGV
jgi:hypothetical protein